MKVTRDGVDRSTNYLPEELDAISIILAGWDGEVGQGTMPIPDPSGNQEPYEGEQLLLEQSSQTIIDGFLGAVTSERGGGATGTRRVHTVTIGDDNALLAGHATPGWARPAESAHARWAAFVDDFLPGSIDTTWLLTTNESGITLPKKTYRTDSLFDDLSADTIGPTGKTVYIEHRNFHWHLPTEGQTCSLSIHDTTWNGTTSFFPTSPTRSKDGMDLRTKLYGRNKAGKVVSVSDATAISRHEAAGLKHQGYSEYDTETETEMTRDLNVTLLERKQERITYGYTIGPLTAAQVVALIPGSQMTVTVGLHGLSGSVKRIARVTLEYHHGRVPYFMATLELGFPRRVKRKPTKQSSAADSTGGSGVAGSEGCGCPPFTTTCQETFARFSTTELGTSELDGDEVWQNNTNCATNGDEAVLTDDAAPYLDLLLAAPMEIVIHQVIYPGGFIIGGFPYTGAAVTFFETGTPNPVGQKWCGYNWTIVNSGGPVLRLQTKSYSPVGGVTLTANNDIFTGNPSGLLVKTRVRLENTSPTVGLFKLKAWMGSEPEPTDWTATINSQGLDSMGSLRLFNDRPIGTVTTTQFRVQYFRFGEGYVCIGVEPKDGQLVSEERVGTGDGSKTVFYTNHAYTAGSLKMRENGVPQTWGIDFDETDPQSGKLTFAYAPKSGAEIVASEYMLSNA